MVRDIIKKTKPKMDSAVKYLEERLKGVRTGGAQAGLVEDIKVDYYGAKQPLKSLAQITTPEPSVIYIQPFDRNSIGDIRLAIINADLGFNPSDDGQSLRIIVPTLTEERRQELIKFIKNLAEETRISLRNIREEAWKEVQKQNKEKLVSDDDRNWGKEELDKVIAQYNEQVETKLSEKEEAIKKV